jgi:hypothetical protein
MKDPVDKSMGIETHIEEVLTRIKPTDLVRLVKREALKKRNCSDSSGNSPTKILHDVRVRKATVQSPHRLDPKCLRKYVGRGTGAPRGQRDMGE